MLWHFGLAPMLTVADPWSPQTLTVVGIAFLVALGGITKVSYLGDDGPVDRTAMRLIAAVGLTGTGVAIRAISRLPVAGMMDGVSSPTAQPDHQSPFRALPPQVDLPSLEHEVLDQWAAGKVFARSLEGSADKPQWVFYEGPPTANGRPGTHHIEARAFKDVFPRFKTMQGWHVPRRAGWDCHGLPVEIAVEQELGFAGKPDIERFGIAEFNARCRESVERHVDAFAELTDRMGYWVDLSTAYRTMDSSYVQSVWWSLKQIADRGLLVEDHRVAPYCPRCGTEVVHATLDRAVGRSGGGLRTGPRHGRPEADVDVGPLR